MSEITQKDKDHLLILFAKTKGEAWEPPVPKFPWLITLIEAGYLKRCDMRCGFEAFKDSGVTWTEAGRQAVQSIRFEEALKLVCDWSGNDPERGNTVIALGVRAILAGENNDPAITKARDLVRQKVEARIPKVGP